MGKNTLEYELPQDNVARRNRAFPIKLKQNSLDCEII